MMSLNELRAREEGSGLSTVEKERERWRGLASSNALEFGGVGGMSGGVLGAWCCYRCGRSTSFVVDFSVCIETLMNMINTIIKTTSLLPGGLFASLGVTRGVESDMRGVKLAISFSTTNHHPNSNCYQSQDIDHSLRKSCSDAIAACADPICDPLEKGVAAFDISTNASKPSISLPPAAAALPSPPPATVTEIPSKYSKTKH